ncbi:unnamed protein product, partial [Linum tenue]
MAALKLDLQRRDDLEGVRDLEWSIWNWRREEQACSRSDGGRSARGGRAARSGRGGGKGEERDCRVMIGEGQWID